MGLLPNGVGRLIPRMIVWKGRYVCFAPAGATPLAMLSTESARACLHNDIAFVWAFGAFAARIAIRRRLEEVHSTVRTVGKDVVVFDIFAHVACR